MYSRDLAGRDRLAQQTKLGEPVCVFRREGEGVRELYPLFINHVNWLAASILFYMYDEEEISSH